MIRRMEVTAAGASRSYREWGMISAAAALGLVGMFLVVRRTKAVRVRAVSSRSYCPR